MAPFNWGTTENEDTDTKNTQNSSSNFSWGSPSPDQGEQTASPVLEAVQSLPDSIVKPKKTIFSKLFDASTKAISTIAPAFAPAISLAKGAIDEKSGRSTTDNLPFTAYKELSKPIQEKVVQPVLDWTVNTPQGQRIVGDIAETTRGSNMGVAVLAALDYAKGEGIDKGEDYFDIYYRIRQEVDAGMADPDASFSEKLLYGITDSGPQTLVGVGLGMVPLVGGGLSGTYFGAISAADQIEQKGKVTDLTPIGIDVVGDRVLGGVVEGLLKKSASSLAKAGFVSRAKDILKTGLIEGSTESAQSMLKYANDYGKAETTEDRQKILQEAKQYVTEGGMLLEFLVGGLAGAGIASVATLANSPETIQKTYDKDFNEEQNKYRQEFRNDVQELLGSNDGNVDTTAQQVSEETGMPLDVATSLVQEISGTNFDTLSTEEQKKGIQEIAGNFRKKITKEEDSSISESENALYEEARKYESAEDFVDSQTKEISSKAIKEAPQASKYDFERTSLPIENIKEFETVDLKSSKFQEIKKSVSRGDRTPIIVDERNRIIDGHHRFNAYKESGANYGSVPVLKVIGEGTGKIVRELNYINPKTKVNLTDIYNKATGKVDKLQDNKQNEGYARSKQDGERKGRESGKDERTGDSSSPDATAEQDTETTIFGRVFGGGDQYVARTNRAFEESGSEGSVEKISQQARDFINDKPVEFDSNTKYLLKEAGFSDVFISKLEFLHKKGGFKNIQLSGYLANNDIYGYYHDGTLHLNPLDIKTDLYQSGKVIDHEIEGHSWFDKLSKQDQFRFYEGLKNEKNTIREAWEKGDNDHRSYWADTVDQINKAITENSNESVQKSISEFIGLQYEPGMSLDTFIDRSLGIDNIIESINTELFKRGYSPLTLKAEKTQAVMEHGAMIAEFASELTSDNDSMIGMYIDDIRTGKLSYGPNSINALIYQGQTDLTLKTLEKLKGRSTVSKQFIMDLTNSGDIKQVERDIIRDVLREYTDGQIPVQEFADKITVELLPLKINTDVGTRYEFVALPSELIGNVANYEEHVYESPINTSAGHSGHNTGKYFGHTRVEDMDDGNTRRIIEVQSDLYQKGNLEREKGHFAMLPNPSENYNDYAKRLGDNALSITELAEIRNNELARLEQYNNPTAHFRMVREEVRKAAQDGKEILLFPTGETAMKIEGLGVNNPWSIADRTMDLRPDMLKEGMVINQGQSRNDWIIIKVLGDGKFEAVPRGQTGLKGPSFSPYPEIEVYGKKIPYNDEAVESFDISGKIDTNNPIYRFYEKDLGRYLKSKYDAKPFTDENGVSWYEVKIYPDMGTEPVLAFRKKDQRTPQEILAEAEALAYGLKMPESGPRNITQAEDMARVASNFDDFQAILRGGEQAVQPFYEENSEVPVVNPNYEKVLFEIKNDGYTYLESFYQKNKAKPVERMQSISDFTKSYTKKISTVAKKPVITRGKLSEEELDAILTAPKVEAEKVTSVPTSKIPLSPELDQAQEDIDKMSMIIAQQEEVVDIHPGKKLLKLKSRKEKQFVDPVDPDTARTPAEREEIIRKNKEIFRTAEIAFENTLDYERYSDVELIRETIFDYENQVVRLKKMKQERADMKKKFYRDRNMYWSQERERLAINKIVEKEERSKMLDQVYKILRKEGAERKQKIDEIMDYFYLTKKEYNDIVGNKDFRTMSDTQFNNLLEEIRDKSYEIHRQIVAVAEVERTIADMDLKRVENLQKALKLSENLKEIKTDDLIKLNQLLGMFERGDVFLGQREIETLAKNADLPHVKTHRQIIEEIVSKRTGVPVEKIKGILIKDSYEFMSASVLAQQNPFLDILVTDFYKMKVQAELNFAKIENETRELAKKARASRKRRLIDRIIPTDDLIVEYLEEPDAEIKTKIAAMMTPQELEFAHYVRDRYADMRDYLVKKEVLDKYRENYYTHKKRSFLEAWLKDGQKVSVEKVFKNFFKAVKETFIDSKKYEEVVFKILNDKTGVILPLEKFFQYSMKRSGNLKPTKNVANAFLTYSKTFETKKSLDSYIPVMEATARALTPMEMTEGGVVKDETLLTFVKEWINTQKGRPVARYLKPGSKIDVAVRLLVDFVRFKYLGLRFALQAAAPVGEQITTYIGLGEVKYARGIYRLATKQGRDILNKYEDFVGKKIITKLKDPSRDLAQKAMDTLYVGYSVSNRQANSVTLLGMMTQEEFESGDVSPERLGEMKKEMSRWRQDDTAKSIVGATSLGAVFRQFKGWGIAIVMQSRQNLIRVIKMAKDGKGVKDIAKTREFQELARATILTLLLWLASSELLKELKEKKDRTFTEEVLFRQMTELQTILQAGPAILSVPVSVSYFYTLLAAVTDTARAIIENNRTKDGDIPGLSTLKKSLIPTAIMPKSKQDEKDELKEEIRDIYLQVRFLDEEGRSDEADEIMDRYFPETTEGDALFEVYKQVKKEEKSKDIESQYENLSKKQKKDIEDFVKKIRQLDAEDKKDEADFLLGERYPQNEEGDAGYELYKYVNGRISKEKEAPKLPDGEITESNLIDKAILYGKALGTDPVTAFNRIITGQKIRRIDNGAIIVERADVKKTQKIAEKEAKKMGVDRNLMRLDHIVPLQLGGGNNRKSNLKLITTEEWQKNTPVENYLGVRLRESQITKDEAQKAIRDFKQGLLSFEDIKIMYP